MSSLFVLMCICWVPAIPIITLFLINCILMWRNECKFGPLKLGLWQLGTHRDPDFEREAQSVQYVYMYVLCAPNM